ncbi:hypothetical protein C8F01DRAFT_1376711 [Mycena amicta]|nr:hypothetical protein C8F01DRAFT_1376711 [Mycena amicta]
MSERGTMPLSVSTIDLGIRVTCLSGTLRSLQRPKPRVVSAQPLATSSTVDSTHTGSAATALRASKNTVSAVHLLCTDVVLPNSELYSQDSVAIFLVYKSRSLSVGEKAPFLSTVWRLEGSQAVAVSVASPSSIRPTFHVRMKNNRRCQSHSIQTPIRRSALAISLPLPLYSTGSLTEVSSASPCTSELTNLTDLTDLKRAASFASTRRLDPFVDDILRDFPSAASTSSYEQSPPVTPYYALPLHLTWAARPYPAVHLLRRRLVEPGADMRERDSCSRASEAGDTQSLPMKVIRPASAGSGGGRGMTLAMAIRKTDDRRDERPLHPFVGVRPNPDELGEKEDALVANPLSEAFLELWNTTAKTNPETFPVPTNLARANCVPKVKTWHVVPGIALDRAKKQLSHVKAPLDFLSDGKEFLEGPERHGLDPTLPIYI